ncbi:MAG: ABC transporter permease [Thermotogota bacterium]
MGTLVRLLRTPKGAVGLILVASFIILGLLAPVISPTNPQKQNISLRNRPPLFHAADGRVYLLGTDELGRDLLTRTLFGVRLSLLIGFCAVACSGTIGVFLGVLSGFQGGVIDFVVMRAVDAQLSIPLILLAMMWIAFTKPSLPNVLAVIILAGWVQYARPIRAMTLTLRSSGFVEAAHAIGVPRWRIYLRHILPNVLPLAVVISTLQLAGAILMEGSLSFLGVGLQPPAAALGLMVNSGRRYIDTAWWICTFPGLALMLIVLGVYFMGDALRDTLDPKLRRLG